MENKHTPEPWHTAERSGFQFHIDDSRGESVAVMLADDDHDEQRGLDNARRIVACVNACAGLDVEELERFGLCSALGSEIVNLRRMHDELLSALERIAAGPGDNRLLTAIQWAKEAIAKVKGTNNV